ncbi:MAG: LptF/LptG family permease [Spirochaetales bacterium]|nr:LptF/LptG family permease [Spirochaetales bacterium]
MVRTIDRMVIRNFIPIFLMAILFFVLILELVDLFANLWRYINNEVTIFQILQVFMFYIPKCINLSLPMSLLFAVSYTLGNFYANNELIAVFGSGISLFRFVTSLLVLGILLSISSFFFEEKVVIETFSMKNELSHQLLRQSDSLNNSNPTVIDRNGMIIYSADFYNDKDITLSNIIVIEKDSQGNLVQSINSEWADWNAERGLWEFHRCRRYYFKEETGFYEIDYSDEYSNPLMNTIPFTFRRSVRNVDEMRIGDARAWITSLKKAGLPYTEALTTYYRRFSFSLTPFIVCLLSSAVGGRFKKNILLMSLLTSLIVSVVFYVMQMIMAIFANIGYISPAAGAWTPFLFFTIAGLFTYRWAHS